MLSVRAWVPRPFLVSREKRESVAGNSRVKEKGKEKKREKGRRGRRRGRRRGGETRRVIARASSPSRPMVFLTFLTRYRETNVPAQCLKRKKRAGETRRS